MISHLRHISLIALLVLAASCHHAKVTPSAKLPAAPPRALPVAPEASKVRDQITLADKTASTISTGAQQAAKHATAARQEAERLKAAKSADEAELASLWQSLLTLEAENHSLAKDASRLTTHLADARLTAASLQQYASAKDAEADLLRSQHTHLADSIADYAKQVAALEKSAADHRTKADRLTGEIRLYRISLGMIAILLIGWVAARLFLPRVSW